MIHWKKPVLIGVVMVTGVGGLRTSASAHTYSTQYEMNAQPSTAGGVSDTNSFDWNLGGTLTNVNMPGSGSLSGGSLHCVIISGGSKRGYYFASQSPFTNHSFTIDMRVQVVSGVTPIAGANRSMSFSGGPLNGAPNGGRNRGFRLNTNDVQLVNGAAAVGTGAVDLAGGYVRLRVTYNHTTNNYSVYNLDAGTTLIAPQFGGATGAAAEVADRGGYAIGSLDNTSNSDFHLDYFRVLLDAAVEDGTTPINLISAPGCSTTLDNPATQTTHAAQGQGASPNSFSYTLNNTGTTTVNYTVVEATVTGAATDYTWLSVSPAGGSISAGSDTTITANVINTTGLSPGVYTGYLRFNGCPDQYELRRIDLNVLNCSIQVTPSIHTQPQSQSICAGSAATLSVGASGSGLTYQWRKNGFTISNGATGNGSTYSGATSASLTISGTVSADAGDYDVVVDRLCSPPAPVTSDTVTLGINNPLTITAYSLHQKNYLFWRNPCGDFTGTMIRYRTDTYPTGPTDGTLVVDKNGPAGQNDYHMHTGLVNGTTYYYAAFAHDSVPNYSSAATTSGMPLAPPAGSGPGVPNLPYPSGKLFQIISTISSTELSGFHGMASMHNGYMVIQHTPLSGVGGHAFYDISNPFQPLLVNGTSNNQMMEGHSIGFSNSYPGMYACTQCSVGIQFWDWTNVMNPVLLSTLPLPGISGQEYDVSVWWLFWQAPYVYVGGTTKGLFVVDATNPSNPVLVKTMLNSQTGGFRVGSVFAVGNLLVISSNDANGVATFDISNPINPILLAANTSTVPYSAMLNGDKLYQATTGGSYDLGLVVFDITNPLQINFLNKYSFADRGGYLTVQDGYAHLGTSSIGYNKIDTRNPANYILTGNGDFLEPGADVDFTSVIGNLNLCSDDEDFGSRIIPHQILPDTTPPEVNMINPKPGAINQALTSRIGMTFTDRIDVRSVNAASFIVRPAGGSALPGKYSEETGIVNFCPSSPLWPNTTYEVVVPAGGVKDYAGNPVASTYTSVFSTGSTVSYGCQITENPPAPIGQPVMFDVHSCNDPGPFTYSWNFGDGSPATAFSSTSSATHTYSIPGHYLVIVTTKKDTQETPFNTIQTIYNPLTPVAPARSSTVALDASRQRVWNVNADSNTVTCIDATALAKLFEAAVGVHPRNLAVAPDGNIWVTNQDSTSISVMNGSNGSPLAAIPMPYGSQPYGIASSPTGNAVYVTLMATGQLLKIDPVTRNVLGSLAVGPAPRGIAITHDGARIFVTRFISPVDHGEVVEVSGSDFTVTRTFQLALNPGPDGESASRGVPNYVFAPTIAPDGQRAWVPSKKDNTGRGLFKDGLALTFETTVRTIVSQLDLTSNAEDLTARHDLDNRSLAAAVAFTKIGDYAMVATLGSNTVDFLDAYTSQSVTEILDVGRAPDGLVLSTNGERLFVHNFMSRDVAVYDVTELAKTNVFPLLARISTVQTELLSAQILQGKKIFYNAADPRMSHDKYLSCAACHFDGDSDGRVWDFTDRGEGLRNTTALTGRAGMRHGPVHWSANFDEIQDFEHDIRDAFGGSGFMPDFVFNTGTRNQPLGDSKAGFSTELDALAVYVSSLKRMRSSPFRNSDGSMTADAIAGQKIFRSGAAGCFNCHRSAQLSDSELIVNPHVLHDVGTLTAGSGLRLGQPLTGLDTPTLLGLWETAPYLHDGSAATLMDVITTKNPGNLHGNTSQLTATEKQQLVAYLQQLDNVAHSDYEADNDVDQSDFGYLQRCLSNSVPMPGCTWADLNYDGQVNLLDYNLFQTCMTGADVAADLSCAE